LLNDVGKLIAERNRSVKIWEGKWTVIAGQREINKSVPEKKSEK
jgi:hypothetical protein